MDWFVPTPDGRTLAVEDAGDRDGRPVMVHMGTPGGRRVYGRRTLADAERRRAPADQLRPAGLRRLDTSARTFHG